MSGTESLLSVEDALSIVRSEAAPLEAEEVGLDAALGRVLAEPVVSPSDLPLCDRSAMDGFAVRSPDLGHLPADLDVIGFLPAGRSADGIEVRPGQSVRIMTGAPVPAGADAVQMIERTESLDADRRVRILAGVRPGENIFRRGADIEAGRTLLESGRRIGPSEIGSLAAVGKVRLLVHRLPVARVLSTGDEIVDPAVQPLPHQIRNSNGPALLGALEEAGLDPRALGTASDEARDLDVKLAEGLEADLLLLIGGVSVGDRDLVSERLQSAGVRVLFHRIAMKPGKPLLFGRRGRCLVFGLPGNPLSAMTCFFVFVLPAIRAMTGLAPRGLAEMRARLSEPIRQKPGRTWYRLARVSLEAGELVAHPPPSTGSGDLVSATRANAFVVVPADATLCEAGQMMRVLLWPGFASAWS